MRRLSGLLLAGAIMLLPAFSQGHGGVRAQGQALTFDGDTAIVTVAIKPDKTAEFEQIMNDVRAALMKSEKPERKQQAAGWKVVKSGTPMKDGTIVYMHVIDPVVKGADYTILAILTRRLPMRPRSGQSSRIPRCIRGEPRRRRLYHCRRPLEVVVRVRRTLIRSHERQSAARGFFV